MNDATVLIVEDDELMRQGLTMTLANAGFRPIEAASGDEGLAICSAERDRLSVVLLDLGLPDIDGLALVKRIRASSNVPIIVLSGRIEESSQIEALDGGANDYVTKPFRPGELLARVRAAVRWSQSASMEAAPIVIGEMSIDRAARRVTVRGADVDLTPTEYNLLAVLVRNAGKVVTHAEMLREVWGPEYVKEVQYLRVYMKQLRYKLEAEPAQPRYLLTVPGVGYRLKVD